MRAEELGSYTNPLRPEKVTAQTTVSPASVAISTYADQHREAYYGLVPNAPAYTVDSSWPSEGDPHWFESSLVTGVDPYPATASFSRTFSLKAPTASAPTNCSLTSSFLGNTSAATAIKPAFQVAVTITDPDGAVHTLPSSPFNWQGQSITMPAATTIHDAFPCGWISSSTVTTPTKSQITFTARTQPGTQLEQTVVRDFAIGYAKQLCAQGKQLDWTSGAGSGSIAGYRISGYPIHVRDSHGVLRLHRP